MTTLSSSGERERPGAVELMRRLDAAGAVLTGRRLRGMLRRRRGRPTWPPLPGSYLVGDPQAPVAVCTLADEALVPVAAGLPGVAIAGRVHTANLGLEKIIANLTANPRIRFLLLVGADSVLFRPGQTLTALAADGVDGQRRVVGANGYLPVLRGLPAGRIDLFRRQVEVVDCMGETDPAGLARRVRELVDRDPGRYAGEAGDTGGTGGPPDGPVEEFALVKPGRRRRDPLGYDPAGYVVISVDRAAGQIMLRHYRPDNSPAHQMFGHSAEPMLAGLLRERLVSQLSHAGYLGAELAKAETALRLGLRYEQDRPLRDRPTTPDRG